MARGKDAEPLYLRTLAILEQTAARESLQVAAVLIDFAQLYVPKGGRLTREPYEIIVEAREYPVSLPTPAQKLISRSIPRSFEKAEPLYRRALAILEKQGGVKIPSYAMVLQELAMEYREAGRNAEAEKMSLRAIEALASAAKPNVVDMAIMEQNLAEAYRAQKKYDAADGWYREAISLLEKEGKEALPYLGAALERYARYLNEAGRKEDAKPVEKRAKDVREELSKQKKGR